MTQQKGSGGAGLYVVHVPRPPDPPRRRRRSLPTHWNGRKLQPDERQIIADGFDQAYDTDILKGVTT